MLRLGSGGSRRVTQTVSAPRSVSLSQQGRVRMISRRRFAAGACAVLVGAGSAGPRGRARAAGGFADALSGDIAKIEVESGGLPGVGGLATLNDARFGQACAWRIPLCRTAKPT